MALREERVHHRFVRDVVRTAFTLASLVAHNVTLVAEQCAVEAFHQEAHAVALQPQRELQLIARHGFEVVGAVEVGRSIHVCRAGVLDVLDVRLLADMLRAFEHHVLKQMREAGAARPLIQRPHVIPEVDGDERQPVIFMRDHRQAVGQRVLLVLDLRQLEFVRGGGGMVWGLARNTGSDAAQHRCRESFSEPHQLAPLRQKRT